MEQGAEVAPTAAHDALGDTSDKEEDEDDEESEEGVVTQVVATPGCSEAEVQVAANLAAKRVTGATSS